MKLESGSSVCANVGTGVGSIIGAGVTVTDGFIVVFAGFFVFAVTRTVHFNVLQYNVLALEPGMIN